MKSIKKFIGEKAYNVIKNRAYDAGAIRKALVTPQNARNVFSELEDGQIISLCTKISGSKTIGQVRETTQEEITEAFGAAGYDTVIFDDEAEIAGCEKYYKNGEVICTYNNLAGRMRSYHMIVAIRKGIDSIDRLPYPERDDEYGTSILNIQIAKNGSHMSIKNRYNHTVQEADSTLDNDLDKLFSGLQEMVLGYYGFASLSNSKEYYPNIVNIGGIYLKYHTESNNVYYGAFLLDGVNGARYTDTSRYYVTKGNTDDSYVRYSSSLVLDFQKKKVYDVESHYINSKVPLLERAMREGALSSANKEDADTMQAVFPDAKRELLQSCKNALQFVHDKYGYDFEKPFTITGFLGKFTAKSIEKAAGSDTGILLIYPKRILRVCEMDRGRLSVDIGRYMGERREDIDSFYTKGDMEKCRKSGYAAAFFIQQDKQYILHEPIRSIPSNRDTMALDENGRWLSKENDALLWRLREYKRQKRAREVAEADFSKDIEELEKSFIALKALVLEKLQNAETYEQYEQVGDAFDRWESLAWIFMRTAEFKKKAEEKGFSRLEYAREELENIKEKIEIIKTEITKPI